MTFSVLICTYNRPDMLAKCLSSLIVGTNEHPDQIVVVNGGDERSDQVVKLFIGKPGIDVKLVKTINKNLATSRNVGLSHCVGDIVAMTDDDAEVFPDWVTQMRRVHSDYPEVGAVGGVVLGNNTDSLVGKVADAITFPSWSAPQYVRTLPGVNISYKREVIEKIGLQDETLFRGEDVDYNWRVQQLGYKVYFDPAIKVWHYHRPTLKGFLNQHYMYGRAYYLVRRKWLDMYCVYPHQIHTLRDFLKGIHFFAALLYQPVISATQIPHSTSTRIAALPLLFSAGIVWKWGMIREATKWKMVNAAK
ncbi:MAG: glycosyltransferase [Chitinophagaceae bacterium]